MSRTPLYPDNQSATPDRDVRRGHGTKALGPSDSSDNGSDLQGAPGLAGEVDGYGLPTNDNETEQTFAGGTAGPDVGDADLDSDSDRYGTGERASAGRDTLGADGGDIDTDHIEDDGEEPRGGASTRKRPS